MKKLLSLIIFIFTISISSNAQTDAKAKEILDNVSAKIKTFKSLRANFVLAISKTRQKKSGTVYMKGNKYLIDMPGQQVYCDNRTISTYNNQANEVTINDIDPSENTITPTKLFTNFYDKEFKSKYISEKKVGTSVIAQIELVPLKPKNFTKVVLMVDKTKGFISGGNVYEKNGNVMTYSISNLIPNTTLADALFIFDSSKHKGIEVVDLR